MPAATRTLAGAGRWMWQGRNSFTFGADGSLVTPWHRGVWGLAADRGADAIFARFASIDHLIQVSTDGRRMQSTRCEDGDQVSVEKG